jgi:hypothetical protein
LMRCCRGGRHGLDPVNRSEMCYVERHRVLRRRRRDACDE